jgi:polysaccharide biosynthesis protein PslH
MKILFLSRWFPYPPDNGSKLRIYNLLRGLSQHHEVSLLTFYEGTQSPPVEDLKSICQEIRVIPWKSYSPDSWRARFGFFQSMPRSMIDTFSFEMASTISETLSSRDFDLVIASEIWTAVYSHYFMNKPALFDDLELGAFYDSFMNEKFPGKRLRHWLTWKKYSRYLASMRPVIKAFTVVSQQERGLLHKAVKDLGKTKVEVFPNCINLTDYRNIAGELNPNALIFTGSLTYSANYDAVAWFLEEVYPLVQARVPSVQFNITGDPGNRPLPESDNVVMTGFVQDVRPLITSACVSLAPIWSGGGTRLKILEAMALHTPVVSTSKGAEGLDVENNVHLMIADAPESFAECVIRLLTNPHLRQRIGDNACNLVEEKYDWAVVMPKFLDFIEDLLWP